VKGFTVFASLSFLYFIIYEANVTFILIRNRLSFGFKHGITTWIIPAGLLNTFVAVAMISIGVIATLLPMATYGKSIRRHSAKRYWRYVESGVGL
jgi:hypothetical protein